MKSLQPVWKDALYWWAPAFKRCWSWLVLATTIDELSSLLSDALRHINDAYLPLAIVFTVTVQLLLSGFGIIIINQMIQDAMENKPTRLVESLRENLKAVFVESARALMQMMLGFVLFVIPGLVVAVRLYFVPYIAQFDPLYKEGKVDALEKSRNLCRGYFWRFSWILLLSTVLSMVPSVWLESIEIFHRPFTFVMAFFVSMVLELYSDVVLFCAYKRLHANFEEKENGPSVSLQRIADS